MTRGILIALEGIDGSGTTTQLSRLGDALRSAGWQIHMTAEPSQGPVGRLIRRALKGELGLDEAALAALFAADRLDHVQREIEPALARGQTVLSDRYLLSSLAYQSVHLPLEWVRSLNAKAPAPKASILLRVSGEIAAARRAERGGEAERFDALARQQQVARCYEEVLTLPEAGQAFAVRGDRSADEVAADLRQIVWSLLGCSHGAEKEPN